MTFGPANQLNPKKFSVTKKECWLFCFYILFAVSSTISIHCVSKKKEVWQKANQGEPGQATLLFDKLSLG